MRRRVVAAIALVVLALVALVTSIALRAIAIARQSITAENRAIDPSTRARAHRDHPTLQEVAFTSADGTTLRGWSLPSTNGAAIIFVHGGGGDRTQLFPEAELLARHGYGVLTYDARGAGESDAAMPSWGDHERRDLRAAIDVTVARADVDPSRLGLVGLSVGASAVALVAADDRRARAVLLYATWTSLQDEVDYKTRRYGPLSQRPAAWALRRAGVDLDAVRPVDAIAKIAPRPLLMIIGADDLDTPTAVTERLFASAHEPKSLWVIPHVAHGGYLQGAPAEYERRVVAFFDAALLGVAPSTK